MFSEILVVIVFFSVLILVHEFGHFLAAKRFGLLVEEFGLGLPPRLFGKKIGETIYSVNALPFGGFVKIYGENGELPAPPEAVLRSFASQPAFKKTVVIAAGVLMNFVFGWLALSGVFLIGAPESLVVSEVREGSPAAGAGVKAFDGILSVSAGGETLEPKKSAADFINFVKNRAGSDFILRVQRGSEVLRIEVSSRERPPAGEGVLGIGVLEAGIPKKSPGAALKEGLVFSFEIVKLVAISFFYLVKNALTGAAALEGVAGPVGLVGILSGASGAGFVYLLQLFGLISINLAVLNILPIPALDGGRLVFIAIGKAKGSPVSAKLENLVNAGGFAALIAFMIIVTIKDVARLF